MNAVPPSLTPGNAEGTWNALHDAAAVLAALAEVDQAAAEFESPALPLSLAVSLAEGPAWRRELFERSARDAAAALQPGIAALAALSARGVDARCAAQALWDEFLAAREALRAFAAQAYGEPREA